MIERDNKQYLTPNEFAEREKVSGRTIFRYISEGKLSPTFIEGEKGSFLEWESQSKVYNLVSIKKAKSTRKDLLKTKNDSEGFKNITFSKSIDFDSIDEKGFEESIQSKEDLSRINPSDYTDCLLRDNSYNPIKDIKGKYQLDYTRLKARLYCEKYRTDTLQRLEPYIKKEEYLNTLKLIEPIDFEFASCLPKKYAKTILQWLDNKGYQIQEKEAVRQSIESTLKRESEDLTNNLKDCFEQMEKL